MYKKSLWLFVAIAGAFNSFGQQEAPHEWYLSESNGGLCNASIVVYTNGEYIRESGCEGSSHISYGKWEMKKDTMKFQPLDNKTFRVIKDVVATKTSNTKLEVRIFDRNGTNITERVLIVQYVNGKGFYSMDLDSSKLKRTEYIRDSGVLVLRSLQRIFRQKLEIVTAGANNFVITLNIPGEWIFNSYADWGGNGDFSLLRSKDKLTSVQPGYFGVNGPERTVYLKQKE